MAMLASHTCSQNWQNSGIATVYKKNRILLQKPTCDWGIIVVSRVFFQTSSSNHGCQVRFENELPLISRRHLYPHLDLPADTCQLAACSC